MPTFLSLIAARLDDDRAHDIAHVDYGQDATRHAAEIRRIRATGEVADAWCFEAFQLYSYREPYRTTAHDPRVAKVWRDAAQAEARKPASSVHVARVFCATIVLMREASQLDNVPVVGTDIATTLRGWLDSAIQLPIELRQSALAFLSAARFGSATDRAFAALAAAILARAIGGNPEPHLRTFDIEAAHALADEANCYAYAYRPGLFGSLSDRDAALWSALIDEHLPGLPLQ